MTTKAPKAKAMKAAKADKQAKPAGSGKMDKIVEACTRESGATAKELAAISGWQNAGWNTIMANLAKSRKLELVISKTQLEGSKRQINVFRFQPLAA